jgi:recombination endonuclease VII
MAGFGGISSASTRQSLDEWPLHRRELLLWRYVLSLDYYGVEDLVTEAAGHPCAPSGIVPLARLPKAGQRPQRVAVLGDDGRHHLLVDGDPVCAKRAKRPRMHDRHHHEQWCGWWTDGSSYRIQAPSNRSTGLGGFDARKVHWTVTFTQTTSDPGLIAKRYRCPINETVGTWPPYQGPRARTGKLLTTLINALGPDCHCCGRFLGVYLDHHPFTGLIRGLVCQDCNSRVDRCPHLSDCPFADYLNAPPALPLHLKYPRISATLRAHQTRVEYTGLDPFTHLRPTRS